jgi:hypothetical protein
MAKKILFTLMALSLATAAFAAGQKEQAPTGAFQGEKLVLKGTVSLKEFPPVLKSGDKQYLLMVPPYLVDRSGVKDGAQVSVQGYQVRTPPFFGAGGDKSYIGLYVTQATIDGKDYDLTPYHGGWMMGGRGPGYGPGWGMMGRGYGPGYGHGWGMMGGRGPRFGGPFGPGNWDDEQF